MAFIDTTIDNGSVESVVEIMHLTKVIRDQISGIHAQLDDSALKSELGSITGKLRALEEKLRALDDHLALVRRLPGFSSG
jgi:hypothetical protein